jgi:pimeloyl-ACP methyl ester carboxylesterase
MRRRFHAARVPSGATIRKTGSVQRILRYTKHSPPEDQAILARPEIRDMFLASYAESLRQGVDAFAWEVQLAARPWGFALSDIRVPVAVWHGGKDNSVSPVMGKRIAAAIPGAQLHLLPDESHLFFLSRWREILGDLLSLVG